jgi:hypothetical protein
MGGMKHRAEVIRMSRALVKFCRDHRNGAVGHLQGILDALEKDDFKTASARFRSLSTGPYRCDDWFPPVVFEHEDEDYVWSVFESLVERWHRLMTLALGK